MLTVLHHMVQRGVMPEIVIEQMNGLSSLPRIQAVSMFCSKQDQDKLRSDCPLIRLMSSDLVFNYRYIIDELEIANSSDKEKWRRSFAVSAGSV